MPTRCLAGLVVLLGVIGTGCSGGDVVEIRRPDIGSLFWAVTTDIKATTIPVNGTQQLVATPRNSKGEPIPTLPKPIYRSADVTKVTVDSNGMIRGVATTLGNVMVIASLTVDGLTNADTTYVAVSSGPNTFKSFKLMSRGAPPTTDSTIWVNRTRNLFYAATDSSDLPLTGLSVAYRSLDPTIATVSLSGQVRGISYGTVKLVATTTSYGVTKSDTLTFKIIYPMTGDVSYAGPSEGQKAAFTFDVVYIGVNGTVNWSNDGESDANVTFDNGGTDIEGGNITSLPAWSSDSRTFPVAGTYTYKDTITGATGKVVVLAIPAAP